MGNWYTNQIKIKLRDLHQKSSLSAYERTKIQLNYIYIFSVIAIEMFGVDEIGCDAHDEACVRKF